METETKRRSNVREYAQEAEGIPLWQALAASAVIGLTLAALLLALAMRGVMMQ